MKCSGALDGLNWRADNRMVARSVRCRQKGRESGNLLLRLFRGGLLADANERPANYEWRSRENEGNIARCLLSTCNRQLFCCCTRKRGGSDNADTDAAVILLLSASTASSWGKRKQAADGQQPVEAGRGTNCYLLDRGRHRIGLWEGFVV